MSQKSLRREGGETKKNTVNDTKASSSANQSQDVDCYNQVAPKGVPMAVPALPAPPSNQQPRREQCVVISIFCIVHTECTQLRCSDLALAWSGHVLHCRSCHQQGLPAQGSGISKQTAAGACLTPQLGGVQTAICHVVSLCIGKDCWSAEHH